MYYLTEACKAAIEARDREWDAIVAQARVEESLRDENGVPYYLWYTKMFDGRSATDLMNFGELEQHHIYALIAEARLMDEAYERSNLARSKAKPTNDWCNEICIPHQFELDFGDE